MRNETIVRKILPVNLLLEGKPCLVVGGGSIAARKVGHLLDSGAKVTVVSPDLGPDILKWKKTRRITHRARPFAVADIRGQFVVFAATDNAAVNLRVIQACQRRRILCSAVDAHWSEGDFVTPAIIRRPSLTISVSTGGQSCRRSRRVKEMLAQYLDSEKL